jgi:hypothetical protein
MKNKHIGSKLDENALAKTGKVKAPVSKAAKRIDSLIERAQMRGEASTKVNGSKVECFLSASYRWYGRNGVQRLCFRVDGKRISRFDLLAWLDEALS